MSLVTGWRARVLGAFGPDLAAAVRITLLCDRDGLFRDAQLLDAVRVSGFEVVRLEDPIAFRFEFEARFRDGEAPSLVVVVQREEQAPWDVVKAARSDRRVLSYGIAELFPKLSPGVVSELHPSDLDALSEAAAPEQTLGDNATRDFILRTVFEVSPELVATPVDLLRILLRRHYTARIWPASIDARFLGVIRDRWRFADWPLEQILPSRQNFLAFIQERFAVFAARELGAAPQDCLVWPGPRDLPLGHEDVRVYLDNMFADGLLARVRAPDARPSVASWLEAGLEPTTDDVPRRFLAALSWLETDLASAGAEDLPRFGRRALRWGEATAARWQSAAGGLGADELARFNAVTDALDARFETWLHARYASLSSVGHLPRPSLVHQIPHYLAHGLGRGARRALIVVDGLAVDQWVLVRSALSKQGIGARDEGVAAAWIPSLTAVSRQSIFAGEPPLLFGTDLGTTAKEPAHWGRFWGDRGLQKPEIAYICQKLQEDDAPFAERVGAMIDRRVRALGIVVGTIDAMLHGIVTGSDGLHASVRHWAERGSLAAIVKSLLGAGFDVWLTADHGNLEAHGIGRPAVGELPQERSERVHIFKDALTRDGLARLYPGMVPWLGPGLPSHYAPILAPGRGAFVPEGRSTVTHGGASFQEVLVPFVQLVSAP